MNEIALSDQQFTQIERAGAYIAKSKLFGVKTTEEAVALMLVAASEGRNPMEAARDYHIIQGRPALRADAMLARFQQAGGTVKWSAYTDEKVEGTFSHPQGGSIAIAWTFEQAKKIGLTGKDNWKNYPRAMLRSRCISEGIRTIYPSVAAGIYTKEEVEDMAVEIAASQPEMEVEIKSAQGQETRIEPSVTDEGNKKLEAKRLIKDKQIPAQESSRLWNESGDNWDTFLAKLSGYEQPELY